MHPRTFTDGCPDCVIAHSYPKAVSLPQAFLGLVLNSMLGLFSLWCFSMGRGYITIGVFAGLFFLVFTIALIKHELVGKSLYRFRDKEGNRHTHRKKPEWHPGKRAWVVLDDDRPIPNILYEGIKHGVLLQTRLGGIFRKSRYFLEDTEYRYWYIDSWSFPDRVTLKFRKAGPVFADIPAWWAYDILETFPHGINVFSSAAGKGWFSVRGGSSTGKNARLVNTNKADALHNKLLVLEAVMDVAIAKIKGSRQGLGDSPHAKVMREYLEKSFDLSSRLSEEAEMSDSDLPSIMSTVGKIWDECVEREEERREADRKKSKKKAKAKS